jgi:hypothetical protein
VEEAKAIVRPLLDDVLELEFVVGPAAEAPAPAPANLSEVCLWFENSNCLV